MTPGPAASGSLDFPKINIYRIHKRWDSWILYILNKLLFSYFSCSVQVTSESCPSQEEGSSSVVLPRVPCFPCLGLLSVSSPGSRVRGQRRSHLYSLSKPNEIICELWFWAVQINIWFEFVYLCWLMLELKWWRVTRRWTKRSDTHTHTLTPAISIMNMAAPRTWPAW